MLSEYSDRINEVVDALSQSVAPTDTTAMRVLCSVLVRTNDEDLIKDEEDSALAEELLTNFINGKTYSAKEAITYACRFARYFFPATIDDEDDLELLAILPMEDLSKADWDSYDPLNYEAINYVENLLEGIIETASDVEFKIED